MIPRCCALIAAVGLAGVHGAQRAGSAGEVHLTPRDWPSLTRGTWYTGDTHEHVQNCDGSVFPIESVLARMQAEGLNVTNLLVWDNAVTPFVQFVCAVTGAPEGLSTNARILQYGVETSGLDCSKWGHLVGLGIGPEQARIAHGSVASGACADMPGLGLGCAGGDGTGALNAPIAAHFLTAPGAVTGYAHASWTLGLHHPLGFDWNTELLATGFTTDARFLDPLQPLSFPDLDQLLDPQAETELDHGEGVARSLFPLLGAIDAALGEAQFFETTLLASRSPVPTTPPSNWMGLYYKLLSAGLRVSITAGSDRACPLPDVEHPQTSVALDGDFSYDEWKRGIALGRTTLGLPGMRIELAVEGHGVGEDVELEAGSSARVSVRFGSTRALRDGMEVVADGVVVGRTPINLPYAGVLEFTFDVPITASTWVVARLASRRAHTAAVYVLVDGAPVADALAAEYWMMWCDAVTKRTLERPDLALFGCQEGEALERIARARTAFQTYRDLDGIDPAWNVARYGRPSRACRGPIAIGVGGPVVAEQPFRLTCVNAPPQAQGIVYVSRAAARAGTCVSGAERLVSTKPADLLTALPVVATRSGFAEVVVDAQVEGASLLYAQFVWQNPAGCAASSCDGSVATQSVSDALKLGVH